MDESGNAGLGPGATPRFAFSAVVFSGAAAADAVRQAIMEFRSRRELPDRFEFKHARTKRQLLAELVEALTPAPYLAWAAGIEKRGVADTDNLSDRLRVAALEMLGANLHAADIVSDMFGGTAEERRVRLLLRGRFRDAEGRALVKSFRMKRSESEPLLQLADLVAGAASDAIRGDFALARMLGERFRLETKTPADL